MIKQHSATIITRRRVIFNLMTILATLLSLSISPSVIGAEARSNAEAQPNEETAQSTTTEPGPKNIEKTQPGEQKNKSAANTAREIFRPSEEISEDFAVSFPVDI